MPSPPTPHATRLVVLISGRGSNLQALIEANLPAPIAAVISNRPGAGGLAIAQAAGIATEVVDHQAYPSREAFDAALAEVIDRYQPGWIVQAGFMRILTPAFVARYAGRMLNIHPSLLPAFPGLHTHEAALKAGVKIHGCSVHLVTAELDSGPLLAQAAVPVIPGDNAETLAARVLAQEHRLYPQVLRWLLSGAMVPGTLEPSGSGLESAAMVVPALECS